MTERAQLPPVRGNTAFLSVSDSDRIALESLAALYLAGVRRIVIEPVPGGAEPQTTQITNLNRLLTTRGLRPVVFKLADRDELRAWQREVAQDSPQNAGRRGFLTRIAQPVADTVADDEPEAEPLARLQAMEAERAGALFAFAPVFEAQRCTGCDACVNVCPTESLILLKDDTGELAYHCRAQECDGCGLCIAVCDSDAIQLVEMAEQPGEILLDSFQCSDCGVEVHEPRGHVAGDGSCRICRKTGHRKKLFQVLT